MNQAPEHINVTLRLPRDLHQWLKKSADENRRSMSAHTLYLLEQSQRINEILTTGARRPESHEATFAEQLSAALREAQS